jgi:hypothetical protein
MRHRAAAFGVAEVRGGGENGPISRRKSPGPQMEAPSALLSAGTMLLLG